MIFLRKGFRKLQAGKQKERGPTSWATFKTTCYSQKQRLVKWRTVQKSQQLLPKNHKNFAS